MELTAFALMAVLSYLALLSKRKEAIYVWMIAYALYTVVSRLKPPISDIVNYATAMAEWPPPLTLYMLREPVVWIGAALLRRLTGNEIITFLTIDAIVIVIVLRAVRVSQDHGAHLLPLVPTLITSYVFLLGQQNVLRQHVALSLLLWATLTGFRTYTRPAILLVLSILSHNAAVVLFGYWFDVNDRRKRCFGPVFTLFGALSLIFLIFFVRKSSAATGLDTRLVYVVLSVALLVLLVMCNYGRRICQDCPALINFVAFLPAMVVVSSASFERIAMMFLFFIFVDIYRNHANLGMTRLTAGHIAYGVLVLPVFFFQGTLRFLIL